MIDYALDNRLFVLADGLDLLAHIGDSEAPAWRFPLSAPAVAIGQTPTHVITATEDGTVLGFDRDTGAVAWQTNAGAPLIAGASNRGGGVVALTADGRLIGVNTGPAPMTVISALKGANRVALADDGRVLVATPGLLTGRLTELDPAGRIISKAKSSRAIALAWHPSGVWIAGGGQLIDRYENGKLSPVVKLPEEQTVMHLAAGLAGVGVASGAYFSLFALTKPPVARLFQVRYAERVVTGICFGPQQWIALSLAGGDANKIDYTTGATHRSDTHPGRQHNRWTLVMWKANQK